MGDDRVPLVEGVPITFGRGASCTLVLAHDDVGISRLAGSVELDGGVVWLANRSAVRPIYVVDHLGMRSVLAPGRRVAVDVTTSVVVEGQVRRHALTVDLPDAGAPAGPAAASAEPDGTATSFGVEVAYTADDRLALVALFSGYLHPFPRHDPHPRSYADAAATLGWPRTTLVKRIEHLRERLTRSGVPGLVGETALESLAVHVLTTGVVTRHDLSLLL